MAQDKNGSPTLRNMRRERETKDDGRYIIFYTFGNGEAQTETSSEEEDAG